LTAKGVDFESINYMEERLSADELKQLLRGAGLRSQDALRTKEGAYRQVAGKNLSDDHLLQVMAEYPELLPRQLGRLRATASLSWN